MASVLLIGLGFGGYVPAYAMLVRELFPVTQAGQRISEIYFWGFMAAGAGSWTAGWLRDWSGTYCVAFTAGALSACAGMIMLVWLRRRLGAV